MQCKSLLFEAFSIVSLKKYRSISLYYKIFFQNWIFIYLVSCRKSKYFLCLNNFFSKLNTLFVLK